MYLTRLTLDPRSAQARRDLGDAYEMHRTLSRVFADEQAPASRFLWRLEASGNAWSTPTLLVQAASEGNWSVLQALPGYLLGEPQSKSLALRQWLESDISYRFRLFANPTVTRAMGWWARSSNWLGWHARASGTVSWSRRPS